MGKVQDSSGPQRAGLGRVAVVDRGANARRVLRVVRDLARSGQAVAGIAVHAPRDRLARFAREAEESVELEASAEDALRAARADTAWLGPASVAQRAGFAETCARLGIVHVGAPAEALRRLAAPDALPAIAAQLGVPIASIAGADPRARLVEIAVGRDREGTTRALGVGEASLRLAGVAVLTESPSPALLPPEEAAARELAVRVVDAIGWEGIGAVQLLLDPRDRHLALVSIDAVVETAPAVEAATGLDLVRLALRLAAGAPLRRDPPAAGGHAFAARILAQDPEAGLALAPGRVELLRLPLGPGVRGAAAVEEGDAAPAASEGILATIVVQGADRAEAAGRLEQALADSDVLLTGSGSSKAWLAGLSARPEVKAGDAGVGLVDLLAASGERLVEPRPEAALVAGAIDAYDAELDLERARFLAEARRGRPRVTVAHGRTVELRHGGQRHRLRVCQTARDVYLVGPVGAAAAPVRVERLGRAERRLAWRGRRWRVLAAGDGAREMVQIDGVPHALVREPAGVVPAPVPAVVLAIPVVPGQAVAAGEPVARLESMRSEVLVEAPAAGIVRDVLAAVNARVAAGAPLVRIEASGALPSEEPSAAPGPAPEEPARPEPGTTRERYLASLDELRSLALGFDVAPAEAPRTARWGELTAAVPGDDPEVLRGEDAALRAFVDVQWLFAHTRVPGQAMPPIESFWRYLYSPEARGAGLAPGFLVALRRALAHYGASLEEPGAALDRALLRTWKAHERIAEALPAVLSILERRLAAPAPAPTAASGVTGARELFDRLVEVVQERDPALADLAREVRFRQFDQPALDRVQAGVYFQAEADLERLPRVEGREREALVERLVECTQPIATLLIGRMAGAPGPVAPRLVEALLRRYYRIRPLGAAATLDADGVPCALSDYERGTRRLRVLAGHALLKDADRAARRLARLADQAPPDRELVLELYLWNEGAPAPAIYLVGQDAPAPEDALAETLRSALEKARFRRPIVRATFVAATAGRGLGVQASQQHYSFRGGPEGFAEDLRYRGMHPMLFERMQLDRLSKFELERLPSAEDVYLFRGVARENPEDERLFGVAEVRDLTPVRDEAGRIVQLPALERMLQETLAGMRVFQARRPPDQRLEWNRVLLTLSPPLRLSREEFVRTLARAVPDAEGLGLEMLLIDARVPDPETGELERVVLRVLGADAAGLRTRWDPAIDRPIEPLTAYQRQVVQLRRRGLTHPHEIVRTLAPPDDDGAGGVPRGEFVEHDLDAAGALAPVDRAPGGNVANVVVGVVASFTARHPEGMRRVVILSDPAKELGAVAEPECRRIVAAFDLAERLRVPVEWFEVSAGAKISMTSGTENLDWTSRVLRRIIEFTDRGGEVNVVVCGITVGAPPYWNAEATMLMHTKGILVMAPGASMVLTGKEALEYSGGVAAEDNEGIGGYDRIMGPNGQAQYRAGSVAEACAILMRHHEHAYVAPGERFARRAETADPRHRDVRLSPHGPEGGAGFETVGDIFSPEKNPDRRKPFDIRRVMAAAIDQDHPPLERWPDQRGGDTAVVWDAHLGGWPVCLVGIESRPIPRLQFAPADGPQVWSAATLFPQSSKKIARAIHAASGSRPVVVLANLAGFDGSPESMRRLQLEYGAEIGRAIVKFRGPIVLVVVSRYHGAAFVVFAKTLREGVEIAAIEGARASVIGGAPAAGVVFAREVEARTRQDARVKEAEAAAEGGGPARTRFAAVVAAVRAEKLGEVADEFDRVHSIERALKVGSIDRIIAAADLRPYLIDAVERGIARASR